MKKVFFFLIFVFPAFYIFTTAAFATDKVDINTASSVQLDTLTGIGPKYAQAIIDARPFSSVDDLIKVKGIGPATLQKIKDQGLACVRCQTAETLNGQTPNHNQIQNPNDQKAADKIPAPTYPSGVLVNEILPNPEGADETDEWVELYNSNNFAVDLQGWKIQDTAGSAKTYTIGSLKISAYGFLVFKRPDTKIMLNNDGDGLNLLSPDGKIVDSVNYPKAPLGQSYNKTPNGWIWGLSLTPGAKNIIPSPASADPSTGPGSDGLQNVKKSDNSNKVDAKNLTAGLARGIDQEIKNSSPWFLFFTVLATAIILAIVVLTIKLRFTKKEYERT